MPAGQMEVLEYYQENAQDAATVGEYIRVVGSQKTTCFGPKPNTESHGWEVKEIDWQKTSFLLAPKDKDE